MTTGRARLSQDNIQWCSRCRQTPFRPLMTALAANGRKQQPTAGVSGASSDPAAQNRPASDGQPRQHWDQGRAWTSAVACVERARDEAAPWHQPSRNGDKQ